MHAERLEMAAIYLIGGMALGVMEGGPAFPGLAAAFGDTAAAIFLGVAGTALAGIGFELVAGLIRSRH